MAATVCSESEFDSWSVLTYRTFKASMFNVAAINRSTSGVGARAANLLFPNEFLRVSRDADHVWRAVEPFYVFLQNAVSLWSCRNCFVDDETSAYFPFTWRVSRWWQHFHFLVNLSQRDNTALLQMYCFFCFFFRGNLRLSSEEKRFCCLCSRHAARCLCLRDKLNNPSATQDLVGSTFFTINPSFSCV